LNKNKNIIVKDLGKEEYQNCFEIQKKLQKEIINIKLNNRRDNLNIETPNYLLVVEHNHVYTLGKSGDLNNLLYKEELLKRNNISFHHTNRGGDITYHGPGQLVLYPIIDLENFFTDIHKYLRLLEKSVIDTLKIINIKASISSNRTGVWLDVGKYNERKICAMGVKVSRWVTMHGLALNITNDLSYFDGIIPCGLENRNVTSVKNEIGNSIGIDEIKSLLIKNFSYNFNATII